MHSTITKPTVRSNDTAAMRALAQWDKYEVTATATGWTVKNRENGEEYHVLTTGECDCPHAKRINQTGACCKHFSRADLAERMGQVKPAAPAPAPAPEPKGGRQWSQMTREEKIRCMCGPDS